MHTNPNSYAIRTLTFMLYEPILMGTGVVGLQCIEPNMAALLSTVKAGIKPPGKNANLLSGRCCREIVRLWRLRLWSLQASCNLVAPKIARLRLHFAADEVQTLRFLQRKGCEPARSCRGRCDFVKRAFCR